MKRLFAAALAVSFLSASAIALAAPSPASPSQALTSKLQWRSIGPFIGGRVVAVAGVPSQPNVFYFGGVQGGVWKSDDYGTTWNNISDGAMPRLAYSIGAIAVADSNPKILYVGTGESDIRGDYASGDGVFKSTDAGKHWSYAGLRDTQEVADLAIDPHDPNVVYAASLGHVFVPNAQRGIFKTTDGGKTWKRVLFVNALTGGVALSMDKRDPKVVYAAMWQEQRQPWKLTSGGPGSGLYKTTDGGAHWSQISRNPGYATGTLGKVGVSVAQSDPNVVYSIVQAKDGGVFRSDNAGKTWTRTNHQWKLRQRAFYYTAIFADPTDSKRAYAPNVDSLYVTNDGGKVWKTIDAIPHGDHHIVWINPRNPKVLLEGNDGGATVSVNGGETWSSVWNQPTGQIYHVALDDQFPFHLYGASQDEGAWEYVSATTGGGPSDNNLYNVALGESTFIAPDPENPLVTFGSGYFSSFVRFNRLTGQEKNVSPWPRYVAGSDSAKQKYRFGWTHPIMFSPANPHELLLASQVLFSSTDQGETWSVISPDLTRNDPSTEGPTGGPVYPDQTGAETYPDINALAVSPLDGNVIWAGSSDGLVHVTKDHGAHWTAVTPPQLPQWAEISSIEASHTDPGTAYLSASRYMWDDFHPYLYETTDYGAHWTTIGRGLPPNQYLFAVRQDPREPRLLFVGTRSTVYVSLDGGAQWQPLTLNLPGVQVRDLAIDAREGELVAATHGRAFWILDNLALLEDLAKQSSYSSSSLQLFAPERAWLTQSYGGNTEASGGAGANPRYGARIFFNLPKSYDGKIPLTLAFVAADGATIRSFSLHPAAKKVADLTEDQQDAMDAAQLRARHESIETGVKPGANAFQWNLKYSPAFDPPGYNNDVTDDFPDVGDGPTTLPGSYSVVLRYGSQTLSQPLTIALDPRVHPAPGDLEARLDLERKVFTSMDRLDRAITAAMAASAHLSPARRAQVDAEIAQLVLLHGSSSEYDVVFPDRIREQLGFLLNMLEAAYAKPTAAEAASYVHLNALAQAGEAKLTALTH